LKLLSLDNFDGFVERAKYKMNTLLIQFFNDAQSAQYGRATSSESVPAWEKTAELLSSKAVSHVTLALANCEKAGRLCHTHPTIDFPYRGNIWPQCVLFDIDHPKGKVLSMKARGETWEHIVGYLPEKSGALVREMMDAASLLEEPDAQKSTAAVEPHQ
jgi:hypothetical protein